MNSGDSVSIQTNTFELLELELDLRLAELWRCADEHEGPWTLELVASYIRAAYGKGYCDALAEPERGKLCTDYGFSVPERPVPSPVIEQLAGGPLMRRGIVPAPPRPSAN